MESVKTMTALLERKELIESYLKLGQNISLIGSSLGGFYSIYLANKYNLKVLEDAAHSLPAT